MMKKIVFICVGGVFAGLISSPYVSASEIASAAINGKDIAAFSQGTKVNLGAPEYDWWYGCSPTAAGMMMGYYDRNGYKGLSYQKLVPGAQAEMSTFNSTPGVWQYNVQSIMASKGHVADFYNNGYLASNDDKYTGRAFDSLADFMGTSQDATQNVNASTTFWNYTDGSKLALSDMYLLGSSYYNRSGMYGMWEYFQYAGYGSGSLSQQNIYNQLIYGYNNNKLGFTFDDYRAEIDAGRVVMIHVEGHSMLGFGYDDAGKQILLNDTWSPGTHSMTWGGTYSGLKQFGVTVFEPTGGSPVPLPGTSLLLVSGVVGLLGVRGRKAA
ncbi:MAG: hypothetical protein OEV89_00650 [Desulfobulbaceae bacterium]|nr:hypothetical protein [Desulfobulbaceae bacterium]HIJ89352.1 hypothetical protein [Deltaproteobacteria bacterium]